MKTKFVSMTTCEKYDRELIPNYFILFNHVFESQLHDIEIFAFLVKILQLPKFLHNFPLILQIHVLIGELSLYC